MEQRQARAWKAGKQAVSSQPNQTQMYKPSTFSQADNAKQKQPPQPFIHAVQSASHTLSLKRTNPVFLFVLLLVCTDILSVVVIQSILFLQVEQIFILLIAFF